MYWVKCYFRGYRSYEVEIVTSFLTKVWGFLSKAFCWRNRFLKDIKIAIWNCCSLSQNDGHGFITMKRRISRCFTCDCILAFANDHLEFDCCVERMFISIPEMSQRFFFTPLWLRFPQQHVISQSVIFASNKGARRYWILNYEFSLQKCLNMFWKMSKMFWKFLGKSPERHTWGMQN